VLSSSLAVVAAAAAWPFLVLPLLLLLPFWLSSVLPSFLVVLVADGRFVHYWLMLLLVGASRRGRGRRITVEGSVVRKHDSPSN
jgi:hypothetical protein